MKPGAGQGSPLRVAPGVCRGSVPGPMMGDTPSGVVARRMWPSRVASFGRVTHAPADPRALYRASDEHYYICLGRRPGAPKWVPGWCNGGEGVARRAVKNELVNNLGVSFENSGFGITQHELVYNFGMIAMSGTKASLVAMSAGGVEQFGVGFFRPIWFRTRFVSSARAFKMFCTSGSRRPVSPSPCRTTLKWCTERSSATRRSPFT